MNSQENWKSMTIGDLCDTVSITYHGNDKEVILVNTSDVLEGAILNHKTVPNKNLKGQFKKTFQKDDILYSEIRPANRRYAFVDFEDTDQYIASTKLMVLRPRKNIVLPRFLLAILESSSVITELQQLAETRSGTFPQITYSSELAPFPIKLPDIKTQEKIVSILVALDNKIALNTRINDNLAALLHTHYQSCFGCVVTEGRSGVLSDICQFSKERTAVSTVSLEDYFSTENMLPNKTGATRATTLPTVAQTTRCRKGDTLISNIRPYFKKIYYCQTDCACSSDVLCFVPRQQIYSAFLFCSLYDDHFFDYMLSGCKGTKMPRGDKQQIMAYSIPVPSDKSLCSFNKVAAPILTLIEQNRKESKSLASMRDTLLPRLMSGELDVSGPEI